MFNVSTPELTARTRPRHPLVKQHLASVRMLFDWLITGQIIARAAASASTRR
jgi:hypothetical protein